MQLKLENEHDEVLKRADEAILSAQTVSREKRVSDRQIKAKAGLQELDLDSLKFAQGPRLMANKKCVLPKGSTRLTKPGYEEVYVPAVRH
jgi:pre-mRNA-splicing helicase BRR2